MKKVFVCLAMLIAMNLGAQESSRLSKDSIVVSLQNAFVHIADGDGWTTEFTLINLSGTAAPYTLRFFGDDGTPLTLDIAGAGSVTSIAGIMPIFGSTTVQTTGGTGLRQGWARLDRNSNTAIGGQAVFKSQAAGRPDFEASVPIDDAVGNSFLIAFDNTNGYFTGIALANVSSSPGTVGLVFRDTLGSPLGTGSIPLAGQAHTAILINQSYPLTAGKAGTVRVQATGVSVAGLGLRFNPGGAFTSTSPFNTAQ